MHARTSRLKLAVWVALAGLAVVAASHALWLPAVARFLVRDAEPFPSDAIVVLAGDYTGNRIQKATQLARSGYAPRVLVSGPSGAYGAYECDLAIAFMVQRGHPRALFLGIPHDARSTREEAKVIVAELGRLNARKVVVVTSDYHTRRAGRNFGAATGGGIEFRIVSAPTVNFHPDWWWRNREAQKTVFYEWAKTVADWLGI